MSSILDKIQILGCLILLVACSERPQTQVSSVPKPGTQQRLQMAVLSDARESLVGLWGFPAREPLGALLEARVEWESVSDESHAEEFLRGWNGKPMDLLILGPGIPQKVWTRLHLPKVQGRRVLLVGESAVPADDGESVALRWASGEKEVALKSFCKALVKASLEKCSPDLLDMSPRWKDFLLDFVAGRRVVGPSRLFSLDLFSGYVTLEKGKALNSVADIKTYESWRKDFMMKALSAGGSL